MDSPSSAQDVFGNSEQLRTTLTELDQLLASDDCPDREEVLKMRQSIQVLLDDCVQSSASSSSSSDGDDLDVEDQSDFDYICSQLVGHRCQVPYKVDRGIPRHYALVTEVLPSTSSEVVVDDLKVKVIFLYPLNRQMQTCKYYLDNSCTYGEKCKFSHGYEVPFAELLDYVEPDFENVAEGSVCLLQTSSGGLWQLASIVSVSRDEGHVAVRLADTDVVLAVAFEQFVPLPKAFDLQQDGAVGQPEQPTTSASAVFCSSSGLIGSWEEHTRGIGTKLMEKMGFVRGQGLGKGNKGRAEPIRVQVFSTGKGLDKCFAETESSASLEKAAQRTHRKSRAKRRRPTVPQNGDSQPDVFDFLNNSLLKVNADRGTRKRSQPATADYRGYSDRQLNIEVVKVEAEMKRLSKRSANLHSSVERNRVHDQGALKSFDGKLSNTKQQIATLKRQVDEIKKELAYRRDASKTKTF